MREGMKISDATLRGHIAGEFGTSEWTQRNVRKNLVSLGLIRQADWNNWEIYPFGMTLNAWNNRGRAGQVEDYDEFRKWFRHNY